MKFMSIGILCLFITGIVQAQDIKSDSVVTPYKISNRHLSGLDIPQLKLRNHPDREYYQKRLYRGSELSVYILSSETALNEINNFSIDEFVYYLNGKAEITTKDSLSLNFYAGDYLFVPKGFSGEWKNIGGSQVHLELSVIANQRSDSMALSNTRAPFLLDRKLLSGIDLSPKENGKNIACLYDGVELEVLVEIEKPSVIEIITSKNDEFIHVLNGSIVITTNDDQKFTFHSGDFFILPQGFSGYWESQGLHSIRTLKVRAK